MNVLLHMCCAPCTVYPLQALKGEDVRVFGFFFNPNIHPYQEFARRVAAVEEWLKGEPVPMFWDRSYDLEGFLRLVAFREREPCRFCYHLRLSAAARAARQGSFEAFTTTLLYSKYQQHELIRDIGQQVAGETGVAFFYQDFRPGWDEGVARSRELGLYRQPYCGCIFSERDRYLGPREELE